MVGHGGNSAGSYLADPTTSIPSHCASIAVTSTLRINEAIMECKHVGICGLVGRVEGQTVGSIKDPNHGLQR